MAKYKQLNFLQLNCHKRRDVLIDILNLTNADQINISFLQELHWSHLDHGVSTFPRIQTIYAGKKPRAAIFFSRILLGKIFAINNLCDRDSAVASLMYTELGGNKSEMLIASLYFDIKTPMSNSIRKIKDILALAENRKVLFAIDSNAHHVEWGNSTNNPRGLELLDEITQQRLFIHNDRMITFIGRGTSTAVDLTISSFNLKEKVMDWKVNHDLHLLSDHLPITFCFNDINEEIVSFRDPKKIDWDKFINNLDINHDFNVTNSEEAENVANNLTQAFTHAFHTSCPLTFIRNKNKKQWFDSHIKSLRKEARKKWRCYYRTKDPLRKLALHRVYRIAANELKKAIEDAKTKNFRKFCEQISKLDECARLASVKKELSQIKIGSLKKANGRYTRNNVEIIKELAEVHFPKNSQEFTNQQYVQIDPIHKQNEALNALINEDNLREAIFSFGAYKAAGPDGIFVCFLQKTFDEVKYLLIDLFKFSLISSYIPKVWLESSVIFLPKANKGRYDSANSFRPITLMSFVLKTLEKLIVKFLTPTIKQIHKNQYAYLKQRSTIQAINDVVTRIEEGLEQKLYVWTSFLDISGAFDSLAFPTIKNALEKQKVNIVIINWITNMLSFRKVKINLYDAEIKFRPTRGVPQGGVVSCYLWNFCIDELLRNLNRMNGIYAIAYSDDLMIMNRGASETMIRDEFIKALNFTSRWCATNDLSVSGEKSEFMRFTKKDLKIEPNINFLGTNIEFKQQVKYLGVMIDQNLSWAPQLNYLKIKAMKSVGMIKKFAGRTWGMNLKILKWSYEAIILPKVFYSSSIWYHRLELKSMRDKINEIQLSIIRGISYSFKCSPRLAIEAALGVLPLTESLRIRTTLDILRQCSIGQWDIRSTLNHYESNIMLDIKNKLNNYDLIKETDKISNIMSITPSQEDWTMNRVNIRNEIDHPVFEIYSDASIAPNRTGIGVFIPELEKTYAGFAEIVMSSYKAEMIALNIALNITASENINNRTIICYCDNKSVVTSTSRLKIKSHLILNTQKAAQRLEMLNNHIVICWIPSHRADNHVRQIQFNNIVDDLTRAPDAIFCPALLCARTTKKELKSNLIAQAKNEVARLWSAGSLETSKKFRLDKLISVGSDFTNYKKEKFFVLFSFTTGFNFLGKYMRHVIQGSNGICHGCRNQFQLESSEHLLEECPKFINDRIAIFGKRRIDIVIDEPKYEDIIAFLKRTGIYERLLRPFN